MQNLYIVHECMFSTIRARSPSLYLRPAKHRQPHALRGVHTIQGANLSERRDLIDRLKYPSRGGQNLSARYKRLEKSRRGKEIYSQEIKDLVEGQNGPSPLQTVAVRQARRKIPVAFHGFVIPEAPRPPEPDGMYIHHSWVVAIYEGNHRMLYVWVCHMRARPI